MICKLCNKELKVFGMPSHIKRTHNMEPKEYYDMYIEPNTNHVCKMCNKEVPFMGLAQGYRTFCCQNCSRRATILSTREKYGVTNISQVSHINKKMREGIKKNWTNMSKKDREKRCKAISESTKLHMSDTLDNLKQDLNIYAKIHNLTPLQELISLYGTGFAQCLKFNEFMVKYKHVMFVKNEAIESIKQYAEQTRFQHISNTNLVKYGCINPISNEDIFNKVKNTNLKRYNSQYVISSEYGKRKSKETKLNKYGDENYNNRPKTSKTIQEKYGKNWYVETDQFKAKVLQNQTELYKNTNARSKIEAFIVDQIKSYCNNIVQNKKILKDQYLDIYLPDLNIGIECNGIYWHSIEISKSIDYHLNKSIECRNLNIRLIHIYEFEDLSSQIQLLIDLINGQDNYPKNDFNKNNLLKHIPKSCIIYKDKSHTIYGAGKLY